MEKNAKECKDKLQQTEDKCEKYRCKSEDVEKQLAEANAWLDIYKKDYVSASQKQGGKDLSLGEFAVFKRHHQSWYFAEISYVLTK